MYKKEEINAVINDFEKLIEYFGNKCGGEEMRAQLWLFLWELVAKNKAISRRYVAVALRNEFIRYAKVMQRRRLCEQPLEWWENADEWQNLNTDIEIKELLGRLPEFQRKTVILHEIHGLTFAEIARRKCCTRQAVSQAEKRGLDKLRALM